MLGIVAGTLLEVPLEGSPPVGLPPVGSSPVGIVVGRLLGAVTEPGVPAGQGADKIRAHFIVDIKVHSLQHSIHNPL